MHVHAQAFVYTCPELFIFRLFMNVVYIYNYISYIHVTFVLALYHFISISGCFGKFCLACPGCAMDGPGSFASTLSIGPKSQVNRVRFESEANGNVGNPWESGRYTIWLFNSSPWYRWPIEIDGLHIKHGDFQWLR